MNGSTTGKWNFKNNKWNKKRKNIEKQKERTKGVYIYTYLHPTYSHIYNMLINEKTILNSVDLLPYHFINTAEL